MGRSPLCFHRNRSAAAVRVSPFYGITIAPSGYMTGYKIKIFIRNRAGNLHKETAVSCAGFYISGFLPYFPVFVSEFDPSARVSGQFSFSAASIRPAAAKIPVIRPLPVPLCISPRKKAPGTIRHRVLWFLWGAGLTCRSPWPLPRCARRRGRTASAGPRRGRNGRTRR